MEEKKDFEISLELKAQFLRLYQIAVSDGEFDPIEWKMLYQFGEERNIPKEELDKILLTTTGKLVTPESTEEKIEYLYDFARMAWADGEVTEDERTIIQKFAVSFGFLEENVVELTEYLLEAAKDKKAKTDIINELK